MNSNQVDIDTVCSMVKVERYQEGVWQTVQDCVLAEVPVALVYNGSPHVVVMCTPQDITDFVYGFSFTEGVICTVDDITSIELRSHENGIEALIEIDPLLAVRLGGESDR